MEVTAENFSECAAELLMVGGIALYFDENGFTYVLANGANGYSVFMIEEDLQAEWETIWQEIEPHCWPDKEIPFPIL